MIASFDRFSIKLTMQQTLSCSHPGPCDSDVRALLKLPSVQRQLKKIPSRILRDELREYGAWDEAELSIRTENNARIIWIAAGDIAEKSRAH